MTGSHRNPSKTDQNLYKSYLLYYESHLKIFRAELNKKLHIIIALLFYTAGELYG